MARVILILAMMMSAETAAAEPIDVWLDVDTANGITQPRPKDVDDGLAMIQAFNSPEIRVRGVSVVFGNADLPDAFPIAQEIARKFGPEGLRVYAGAASSSDLGKHTNATRALIEELEKRQLTVLALGPVTNVATVLKHRPDLARQMKQIVVCAARRPGFGFYIPGKPEVVLPDANFEKDPQAMQVLLDSGVQLVFAGYEVSCDTWISRQDLEALAQRSEAGAWIRDTSQAWLTRWEEQRGPRGFNPFDTLCVAYVTHPHLIETIPVTAHITSGPDDRAGTGLAATRPTKSYLIAEPGSGPQVRHIYCTAASEECRDLLLQRLGARPTSD